MLIFHHRLLPFYRKIKWIVLVSMMPLTQVIERKIGKTWLTVRNPSQPCRLIRGFDIGLAIGTDFPDDHDAVHRYLGTFVSRCGNEKLTGVGWVGLLPYCHSRFTCPPKKASIPIHMDAKRPTHDDALPEKVPVERMRETPSV